MLPKGINVKNSFEQWIGIAPFAAHEGKVYPPRLTHQVIEQLLKKYPKARIFLFGRGKQEDQYFKVWCQIHPECLYVSHQLESLHQELILMSHLDAMVSMDSSGFIDRNTRCQRVGCNPPICRFPGLGTINRQYRADRPGMPSLQHLWTETLQTRRLCLHEWNCS